MNGAGKLIGKVNNPAVSSELLHEILLWLAGGVTLSAGFDQGQFPVAIRFVHGKRVSLMRTRHAMQL